MGEKSAGNCHFNKEKKNFLLNQFHSMLEIDI